MASCGAAAADACPWTLGSIAKSERCADCFHKPAGEHGADVVQLRSTGDKSVLSDKSPPSRGLKSHRSLKSQSEPELDAAALHGLAGRWAEVSAPYTEASAAGVLVSTLIAFGNAAGRSAFVQVGPTEHRTNENAVLVGPTATGRKGEAMRMGMRPILLADTCWKTRVCRGFGSGEAIVDEVRDPLVGVDDNGDQRTLDAGAEDKRLLIHEDELGHPLAVASRDGSTLSALLRSAWDSNRLENRTKARKLIATDAHVSVLAGITVEELRQRVTDTDVANGFLNRFLLVAVRRPRLLPEPPPINPVMEAEYVQAFAEALAFARKEGAGVVGRSSDASARWVRAYEEELSIDRYGLAGSACARAEAHATRLSLLYALLDRSPRIEVVHVEAALALWRYCEQSATLVFNDRTGNPDADTVLDAVEKAHPLPVNRSEVRDLFSRHRTARQIDVAIDLLVAGDYIDVDTERTAGRPITLLRLAGQVAA